MMDDPSVIDGYSGKYLIYSDGRVWSKKRNRFLTHFYSSGGYPQVKLDNKHRRIHRLLALAFIPNPDDLETVNHKDRNKSNYDLSNLEWMTRIDNVKDGLMKKYTFISPDGALVTFTGLAEFCRNNDLTQANMSKVLAGERPHHKGWTYFE